MAALIDGIEGKRQHVNQSAGNMQKSICSFLIAGALYGTGPTLAQSVSAADVEKAQAEMLFRQERAIERYSKQIEIGQMYVTFCRGELHLKTHQHPINGQIPFGINYQKITDREHLNDVLHNRERYETSFLILCLANAKNTLREAERR